MRLCCCKRSRVYNTRMGCCASNTAVAPHPNAAAEDGAPYQGNGGSASTTDGDAYFGSAYATSAGSPMGDASQDTHSELTGTTNYNTTQVGGYNMTTEMSTTESVTQATNENTPRDPVPYTGPQLDENWETTSVVTMGSPDSPSPSPKEKCLKR
jgi:hypothetical protein